MADEGSSGPGLRKLAEGAFWSLPPCRLCLDDLEEIVGLFRKVHPKVRLRLAGYELESLAAVPQLSADQTHKVDISFSSRDPHCSFGTES
jgi:hypothetical protein